MTSSVVQVHWCDTKLRIPLPIMKQCYSNLAGKLHPEKYTRWYTLWCCYGNMLGSSPFLLKSNITICSCTGQNIQLKMLESRPNEGGTGMLLKWDQEFCLVESQMVIFHFEEAGDWNRACCHSNIKMWTFFCKVQHPCQVSTALLHYWWRYS